MNTVYNLFPSPGESYYTFSITLKFFLIRLRKTRNKEVTATLINEARGKSFENVHQLNARNILTELYFHCDR